MRTVVVLCTGGTIATRVDASGVMRAVDTGRQLLSRTSARANINIQVRDVFVTNSFLLTPSDMLKLAQVVRATLLDPAVAGVVITHGTDTMEESAYLLDLVHDDDRPVVLTGAQRPADAPDSDGPRNLADAVAVAADGRARGLGVLISFDRQVYPARGTCKTHTVRAGAFSNPDGGHIGYVSDGRLVSHFSPARATPIALDGLDINALRVDIAAFYPGADVCALEAFREAGAAGVVLQGTGAGNANPRFVEEVATLTQTGVIVGLSTRVHAGPTVGLYGNGGGVDLIDAGAVPLGTLRAPQGRILLMLLLASVGDPGEVRAQLPRFIGSPTNRGEA